MSLKTEYIAQVAEALLELRRERGNSLTDASFAKIWGINSSVFSQIKAGKTDKLLSDYKWLHIGVGLNVRPNKKKWVTVKTPVFNMIYEHIMTCKLHSKALMFADACEIGKTYTAKYMARTENNVYYVDGSLCTGKIDFIRAIADAIGIDSTGRVKDVKQNIIIELASTIQPVVVIDEFGDLSYEAFKEVKSLWNATEHMCGWYMMGAQGLKAKIKRGVKNEKVAFAEIYSRLGGKALSIVPKGKKEMEQFYQDIVRQVVGANLTDKSKVEYFVQRTLATSLDEATGLRRAETLLILNNAA